MSDPVEGAPGKPAAEPAPVEPGEPAPVEPGAEATRPVEPAAVEAVAERMGATASGLADGEWHRLHKATPVLRGGIAFFAILGIVIANLRERLIELLLPEPGSYEGDPLDYLISEGLLPIVLLVTFGVLIVVMVCFWFAWRMHSFRVTEELVEVRSGVVFRTHRRGRLDRIQGINVQRPLLARIVGAAKLEVEVAGQDANVSLAYLGGAQADQLRSDILRLASGVRERALAAEAPGGRALAGQPPGGSSSARGVVETRVAELLAPELDPSIAPPESVVKIPIGRLIGSTIINSGTVFFVIFIAGAITGTVVTGEGWALFTLVPMALGLGGFVFNRITKSLRYSIAGTRDGVRIGSGLLSIRNDTLPPGRIHSISVSQELIWRPFDWWTIRVNRASRSSTQADGNQTSSTVMPVGSRDDVLRVLELLLPDLVDADVRTLTQQGLGKGDDTTFTNSPPRARVLRWFSRRRNGFALLPGAVLLRRGAIWRELVIVPTPRMQSVDVRQGPLLRALRLAALQVHTVAGPITASIGALDAADAQAGFQRIAAAGIASSRSDRSHRWGAGASDGAEVTGADSNGAGRETWAPPQIEVPAAAPLVPGTSAGGS